MYKSGHSNFRKIALEILDTVSQPLILCFVEFLTSLNRKPRNAMWWTKLELHHMASLELLLLWNRKLPACFMLNSTASKIPQKRINNLARNLHFCEFRNLTKYKWDTCSVWDSSTNFQKVRVAAIVRSFNEDSSFVEMATPEMPCGSKVAVLLTAWHLLVLSWWSQKFNKTQK